MTTISSATSARHRTGGFIGGLNRRFSQYKTYRKTVGELEALTERELADLGVHRSQIRGIAYKAAYEG